MWRFGLVTPDQDTFYPPAAQPSRQETIQRLIQDPNYRLNLAEQIPLDKTAILNHIGSFNIQNSSLVVTWGTAEARQRGRPGKIYPLQTVLNEHEFIDIRNIQMADQRNVAEHRSRSLPNFLQEEGFPLKENYAEADPLTTERGGIIVLDKSKVRIIYPQYFVQRNLIDDEGSLINLGQDESFSQVTMFEVKMRPSLAESLLRYVQANGYFPILRYRSVPYSGEFMLPILDTPMSANGWADLFIDAGGYANLFVAKENTQAEWFEMMNRLKTLFFGELAKKGYHLLGLTKDKTHLSRYLAEKQQILADYFIIRSLKLF